MTGENHTACLIKFASSLGEYWGVSSLEIDRICRLLERTLPDVFVHGQNHGVKEKRPQDDENGSLLRFLGKPGGRAGSEEEYAPGTKFKACGSEGWKSFKDEHAGNRKEEEW